VCGTLDDTEAAALEAATRATLNVVNACSESASVTRGIGDERWREEHQQEHTGGLTGDRS
jgi:predicted GNAT family acetyltransferase